MHLALISRFELVMQQYCLTMWCDDSMQLRPSINIITYNKCEGPRTRVDQPKIKCWILHELCKNAVKKTYIPYEHVVRTFKFLNVQQLLKCILREFPYLEGITQHLWVSPLWFSALHVSLQGSLCS